MWTSASWQFRPLRNPYWWGDNFASHSGSRARTMRCWSARSAMVGIPRGRVSLDPGLGIWTRRTGLTLRRREISLASRSFAGSLSFRCPSTPGVLAPRLSSAARWTARSLADRLLISSLCSVCNLVRQPLLDARKIRFCIWKTSFRTLVQGMAFQLLDVSCITFA